MNDHHAPLAPNTTDTAADSLRDPRHVVLRELLGAYADRELPLETMAQVDAHLIGCTSCRRELGLEESVRARLGAERPTSSSPALRARLSAALDTAAPIATSRGGDSARVRRSAQPALVGIAVSGWVTAFALAAALLLRTPGRASQPASVRPLPVSVRTVPLLDRMLDNYARVTASDLPGRARDLSAVRAGVDFPVEPLHGSTVRLLGAWTTEVDKEPAAVLAYRLGDHLVLQYLVAEDAFFRNPAIRAALESRQLLAADDGGRSLVAWPGPATGSVLVGNMPSADLARVWAAETTR